LVIYQPTYNFAHIVDDIQMGVTIVMRGQEYIPSTPKFLAVYEALDTVPPVYAYLPHIMAPGGNKKLGKRDGAKDVLDYRSEGYLPQTIINFLALLGWNPGGEQEIFTVDELIQLFTLERIQVSGAQMNLEKLDWMNKEHLAKLSDDEFKTYIDSFMPEKYISLENYSTILSRLIPVFRERIVKGSDLSEMDEIGELAYFFQQPTIDPAILIWKGLVDDTEKQSKTKQYLNDIVNILENYDGVKYFGHSVYLCQVVKNHQTHLPLSKF
jgi:glutamyl/glutaminyl-tRNA synthetase